MGNARHVSFCRQARELGLGCQARQVGAGRHVSDLARRRVPAQLSLGGQARQVGLLCVVGEIDPAAHSRSRELVLRCEGCDRARDRLVSTLLRVQDRLIIHVHPPIVIVSPSPDTTPATVTVSPSPEISAPGDGDGEGVGVWSPENTLASE